MSNSPFVLILAGGSGERFWPLSRRAKPKQLLRLLSDESLLEHTLDRLKGFVPPERILILTNQDQEAAVRALLPDLPAENIVAEPAKRDTAAAIALAVGWVARRDSSATMLVLPADHVIRDTAAFQRDLTAAALAAEQTGALVTIGLKPTWACPGFGYIELGDPVPLDNLPEGTRPVYNVRRFREKPAPELAQAFFDHGGYRWNAGMFAWTLPAVLRELSAQIPALADFVSQVRGNRISRRRSRKNSLTCRRFPSTTPSWKTRRACSCWRRVSTGTMSAAGSPWRITCPRTNTRTRPTASSRPWTPARTSFSATGPGPSRLLGVNDLIVVQTGDALLICHRHEAERIKLLTAKVAPELQ